MLRRILLLSTPALVCPVCAKAFVLVTPEEAAAARDAPRPGAHRYYVSTDAPVIEVIRPSEGRPIAVPVSIELHFRAEGTARIDPSTFRARYGALGLDVTSRLLGNARVDAAGLLAENAVLPAGDHRLRLQIGDSQGRVGEREFRFTVLG